MIRISLLNEENRLRASGLSVKEHQKGFLDSAPGIIAREETYRDCNGRVYVIEIDGEPVGLALVREFTEEPLGYDLQQFMIDGRYQGRGYGSEALKLILEELSEEGHYDHVEVCVNKADEEAIGLYIKNGFKDSGYVDEDIPDAINMIRTLNI